MHCHYINLEHATERKMALMRSFETHLRPPWTLSRFSAIDHSIVQARGVQGRIKSGEKGCFLSHMEVMALNQNATEPYMIVEDDVLWGPSTQVTMEKVMHALKGMTWDIVFTDVCIPTMETEVELFHLKRRLAPESSMLLLNLGEMMFAGSTAYVVNHQSTAKILSLLQAQPSLDLPYDLYLRQLFRQGALQGYCVFPFATSLSGESESSQVQAAGHVADLVWNTFRKMIWQDATRDQYLDGLKAIQANVLDDRSQDFGLLLSAYLSERFVPK